MWFIGFFHPRAVASLQPRLDSDQLKDEQVQELVQGRTGTMTAREVETRKANIQGFLSAEAVMEQQPTSTPPDLTNITLLKVNNYLPQKSNYSINNDSSLTAEFLQFQAIKLSCNVPVEHIYM